MKILVTGASGLLGSKLVPELLASGHHVVAIYNRNPIRLENPRLEKYKLDITNTLLLEDLVLKKRPEVIIHAAAYTDVDGCEIDKEKAWLVNVEATRSIVKASLAVKSHLIFISTDYIFSGEKGLYKEMDLPNPINYYGLTKLIGEEIVGSSNLLYTIIRTSAIYGVGGSKKSFAEYVVEKLAKGEKVYALEDQYVSPTLNTLLAKSIIEIVELRPLGILHIAGDRMNRYQFAKIIAESLNLPSNLIEKISIKDMKNWIAKRPRDSSLDTRKARQLIKAKFYDINLAMRYFKKEHHFDK